MVEQRETKNPDEENEGDNTDWMDLCKAVVDAKDPREVLKLVEELNNVLALKGRSFR